MENTENLTSSIVSEMSSKLSQKLEDCIIDGLKKKGFEFSNKPALIEFVTKNVRCEDNTDLKERVYYVNDVPFFLHCYEIEFDNDVYFDNNKTSIKANYGKFAYL